MTLLIWCHLCLKVRTKSVFFSPFFNIISLQRRILARTHFLLLSRHTQKKTHSYSRKFIVGRIFTWKFTMRRLIYDYVHFWYFELCVGRRAAELICDLSSHNDRKPPELYGISEWRTPLAQRSHLMETSINCRFNSSLSCRFWVCIETVEFVGWKMGPDFQANVDYNHTVC